MAVDHTRARLTTAPFVRFAAAWGVALCLLTLAACVASPSRIPEGTPDPDKFLFDRGTEALGKRRWLTAREYFRVLIDTYPQSPHRAEAKLGVADSYLGEGTLEAYVLAINEYREFLNFYPTHARAGYAQFKLGMTYFAQMRAAERDQTETRDAIRELATFLQRYPNDPLVPEGRQRLREARDRLGDSEYRVGYFYFRTLKYYPASIDRFLALLKADPEYTHRDSVYFYLAQSLLKVGRPADALPHLDRLITEFEQSEHLEEARKLVTELKAAITKKDGDVTYAQ
jgi:outer membrane protein assembly factor BamD